MIDEKKLVEKLNKNSIFKTITNVEGKNIYEIIDELPKVGEWIPVSERTPEIFVSVLVNWRRYLSDEYYIDILYLNEKGKFVNYFGEINGEPIAWMPLPKPFLHKAGER